MGGWSMQMCINAGIFSFTLNFTQRDHETDKVELFLTFTPNTIRAPGPNFPGPCIQMH